MTILVKIYNDGAYIGRSEIDDDYTIFDLMKRYSKSYRFEFEEKEKIAVLGPSAQKLYSNKVKIDGLKRLGESAPQPSLIGIVKGYYAEHFDDEDEIQSLTNQYLNALYEQSALYFR